MNLNKILVQYKKTLQGTNVGNNKTDGITPIQQGSVPNTKPLEGIYLGNRQYVPTDIEMRAIAQRALSFGSSGFLYSNSSIGKILSTIAKFPDNLRASYFNSAVGNCMNRNHEASKMVYTNVMNDLGNFGGNYIYTALDLFFKSASSDQKMYPSGQNSMFTMSELTASYDLAYFESLALSPSVQDYNARNIYNRALSMLLNINHEQEDDSKLTGDGNSTSNIYNALKANNVVPTACNILTRRAGSASNGEAFHKQLDSHLMMLKKTILEQQPMLNKNLPDFNMCTIEMMSIMAKIASNQNLSQADVRFATDIANSASGYFKMQTDLMQVLDLAIMQSKVIHGTGECVNAHVGKFKTMIGTLARCTNMKEYMSAEKKIRELYDKEAGSFSIFNVDDLVEIYKLQEDAGRMLGLPKTHNTAGGIDSVPTINKQQLNNAFAQYVNNSIPPAYRNVMDSQYVADNSDEILDLFSAIVLNNNHNITMSSYNLLRAAEGIAVMYGINISSNKMLFDLIMAVSLTAEIIPRNLTNSTGINYLKVVDAVGDSKSISANTHPFISADTGDFINKAIVLNNMENYSYPLWSGIFVDLIDHMGIPHALTAQNSGNLKNIFPGSFTFNNNFYKMNELDDIGALVIIARKIANNNVLKNIAVVRASVPTEWYDGGTVTYSKMPEANRLFNNLVQMQFQSYAALLSYLGVVDANNNPINARSSMEFTLTDEYITNYILKVMASHNNAPSDIKQKDLVAALDNSARLLAHAFNHEFM